MADLDTIMNDLELCTHPTPSACRKCTHKGTPDDCPHCFMRLAADALELIKKLSSTIGITQTATGISIIATGRAEEGMKMGLDYGKAEMHERLGVELIRRGLMTKEIRKVFDEAKSEESK